MAILDFLKGYKKETTLSDIVSRVGGKTSFVRDIYNEKTLTINERMKTAKRLYYRNTFVVAAVNTFKDFIVAGGIKIESSNSLVSGFLNERIKSANINEALDTIVSELLITGNAYAEVTKNPNGSISGLYPMSVSENMYLDIDLNGNVKGYIQQIPSNVKIEGADFYSINYYPSNAMKQVYGIYFTTDEIVHFRIGQSDAIGYGYSPLLSSADDERILWEIERDIAVISRYKAVPKKWINLKGASQDKLDKLKELIGKLKDFENPMTAEESLDIEDISYSGKEIDFSLYLEYFKRKLTVALAPEFIIHGEDTNRATSKEQKDAFMLRASSFRSKLELKLTPVLDNFLYYSDLQYADYDIEWGNTEYYTLEEKNKMQIDLFNAGLVTINEARKELGLEPLDNGEVFSFEVKGVAPSGDQGQNY